MGHSSLLGPDPAPQEPAGRDNSVLGPGDSSDSGSDRAGLPEGADSDAAGTGERRGVEGGEAEAADIGPDHVFTPGRMRRRSVDNENAGERLHDDEDADLDFIDAAVAPDPLEDEAADPDNEPRRPDPDAPAPDPDERQRPEHDDEGSGPPADENDRKERQPGRAARLLRAAKLAGNSPLARLRRRP